MAGKKLSIGTVCNKFEKQGDLELSIQLKSSKALITSPLLDHETFCSYGVPLKRDFWFVCWLFTSSANCQRLTSPNFSNTNPLKS